MTRTGVAPAGIRARRAAALLACALVLGLGGCSASPDGGDGPPRLKVTGAFLPEPPTAAMASGFLTVTNSGGADTLTSVTSGLADQVTLHSTEGGAMTERASFRVPAHGRLAFTRGGNHLMLEQLGHRPREGETVPLTLHFRTSGPVSVNVPVKSAVYNPTS